MILEILAPSAMNALWSCPQCDRVWAVLRGRPGTSRLQHFCDCPRCGAGSLFADPWHPDWEELFAALPPHIQQIESVRVLNYLSRASNEPAPTSPCS